MTVPSPPPRNIAVFIDMENLFGGYGGEAVGSLPLGSIMDDILGAVAELGVGSLVAVSRAYANWSNPAMAAYRRDILEQGIEPVQIFPFHHMVRNAADIELVVDALEVATDSPHIDVFVIVTGDGGFVPLIRRLHRLGRFVIVATTDAASAGTVSALLKAVADHSHVIKLDAASVPRRSDAPNGVVAAIDPATSSERRAISDRVEYVRAVRALLKRDASLGRRIVEAGGAGMSASLVAASLRESIPQVDWAAFGFPKFGMMLRNAVADTDLDLVREGLSLALVAREHSAGRERVQPITDEDLGSAVVVRAAIGAVHPVVAYPEFEHLVHVLDVVVGLVPSFTVDEVSARVTSQGGAVPATAITRTLALLRATGAAGWDTDQARLSVDPSVHSVEDALTIIRRDFDRRSESARWPVTRRVRGEIVGTSSKARHTARNVEDTPGR
ncbi:MAG: hypothetical protein RI885_1387 [Actinomycetota bacterium]